MEKQFSFFSIFHENINQQDLSNNDNVADKSDNIADKSDNVSDLNVHPHNPFVRKNNSISDLSGFNFQIRDNTLNTCSEKTSNSYQSKNYTNEDFNDAETFKFPLQPHWTNSKEEDYFTVLTSFQNWDVVKYREQIDFITNLYVSSIFAEIDRIKILSKHSKNQYQSEKFSKRVKNLQLQQEEFEKFVSSIKAQFTTINARNCVNIESLIESFRKETVIFKQYFPAYGFRQEILNEIEKNQVTIISGDYTYSLNLAIPLLLSNTYLYHTLIVCEANKILTQVFEEKINLVFSRKEQKKLDTQLHMFSENELLKCFSYSTLFSGTSSCIIYSIPLKRSILTDIILSNLRDLLITQKNSKLILLLSPQDDFLKFENFFNLKMSVFVMKLPDLSLPVKTMWKSAMLSPYDNLRDDVVKTILSIHVDCEKGNIMAFLPSLEDIQPVFEELNMKIDHYQFSDLKVICIDDDNINHFLLQEKFFFKQRTVFLLTGHYERLLIPSVCFVIDSGIQKDFFYNSQTDTNVFIPTYISQARAKLRKSLAGISSSGVCFRLYNKSDYLKNFHHKEHAEIFCINPLHSLIKNCQHRPCKSKSIEFVESLPSDVLDNSLKLLKTYGILDKNSCLTSFGENIVKLPFPTKYSRLILHGLQSGFAFETVILVAFFSTKPQLFVESVDDEHLKIIDLKKLDFYQLESDTFTYINIYKLWKENGFRKLWCTENFINFGALKRIRLKINEIIHLVHQYLDKEIIQEFAEGGDHNYLIQMLFECLHNNLCSYSGHPRTGYRILASQQFAQIHSSSFLSQKDNFPEFIICEDLTSSDPNCIMNLTSVPFDLIMEYLQKDILNFNSSDLFDYKLVQKVVDGVGEKIINRILPKNDGKKMKEFEDKLKEKTGAKVMLVEPVLEKGCIRVYAFSDDISNCIRCLKDILDNYIQAMTNEEETKIIEFKYGSNKVSFETKWSKGAETVAAKHVLIDLNSAVQNFASRAINIISEFSETTSINYSLKVCWLRRVCIGECYVSFNHQTDFHRARKLAFKYIHVGEFDVLVQVNDLSKNQLLLSEISPEVTQSDIVTCFSALLPGSEFEVELFYMAPFETYDSDLLEMKKKLEENIINDTNITKFEVKMLKPEPSSKYMTAYINVFEKRCLNKEAKNLSLTRVNNMKLSCEPLYFSDLKCSIEVYNVLKYCINEELELFSEKNKIKKNIYSFKVILKKDTVHIKLSSVDLEIMKLIHMHFNHLLDGIRLDNTNLKDINKLFCHGGHLFLRTLAETEKVYITENYETKTIRLFGAQENCNYVRQYICNFLADTQNEIVKNITLSCEKQNRTILKTIITQYGANLEKFIELCGLRSAALNLKTACLSIYGNKESIKKAEESLKELSATTGVTDASSTYSEETCPVCYCPAESLTFRLQHCGHLYCSICIRQLIAQGLFPIQCCAENCSKPVVLGDIKYLLNDDVTEINELADQSLRSYVDKKRDKIYFCPAADCSMFVYKNEVVKSKWGCPLCKNSICTSCNVVYHEGFSCDMYRGSRNDPDYSFKMWQRNTTQCKQCPKCNTAIEKRDGCNHMTCSTCQTHFCFICVKAFRTGNDVYNHIGKAHPGQLYI